MKNSFERLFFLLFVCAIFSGASCNSVYVDECNGWFNKLFGIAESTPSKKTYNSDRSQNKLTSPSKHDSDFPNWFSISANYDYVHRKTNFFKSGHNTTIFQGDNRVEFWIPPGRESFSWGPYVRYAGLTSSRSQVWENAWLAEPGFGFNVYPFSSPEFKREDSTLGKIFGPLRLFAEHNKMDYGGSENTWRPDEQVRVGLDYWKADYVNNIYTPWWAEIWTGLTWESANEFDKDYDSTKFANSFHFGVRKPNAGALSTFSPYILLESSLTDNSDYYWENRLVGGAGIRYAPLLYKKNDISDLLNRFVIFAEYRHVMAYYRSSAPSSVPDHDFWIGISFSIGEWFK